VGLKLLSVNVGMPRVIGTRGDEPILSGFGKAPVKEGVIRASATGLDGDGQADLSVHGGIDKAIYAYPSEHGDWWRDEKSFPAAPAAFGENLTLSGADETEICIGDQFAWGEVLLEVSQPRGPCFKFDLFWSRSDLARSMTLSGRCGWYYRVLREATAPTFDTVLSRVARVSDLTVREAFKAGFDGRIPKETRMAMARTPSLSDAWRRILLGNEGA
jgi:MOSC domain-containing protein YiiM